MDKNLIKLDQSLHVRRVEVWYDNTFVGAFQYVDNNTSIGDLIFLSHNTILGHDGLSTKCRHFALVNLEDRDGRHAFTVDSFDSMLYDKHKLDSRLELYDTTSISDITFVNDYIIDKGSTVIIIDNQVFYLKQDAQLVASSPFTYYKDHML